MTNQMITVKTNTIKSVQDIVAVQATYDLVDSLISRLEMLSALSSSVCCGCKHYCGSCQLADESDNQCPLHWESIDIVID